MKKPYSIKIFLPGGAPDGLRFLPWQLEKDAATSWAECEAHAAQLDVLWPHARSLNRALADEPGVEAAPNVFRETPPAYKAGKKLAPPSSQLDLI